MTDPNRHNRTWQHPMTDAERQMVYRYIRARPTSYHDAERMSGSEMFAWSTALDHLIDEVSWVLPDPSEGMQRFINKQRARIGQIRRADIEAAQREKEPAQ